MERRHLTYRTIIGLALVLLVLPALAETPAPKTNLNNNLESLRKQLYIPPLEDAESPQKLAEELKKMLGTSARPDPWVVPGSTISTPVAYGAQWTDVFFGVGIQFPNAYGGGGNGSGVAGFGIGNATRAVGLEISLGSYGLIPPLTSGGVTLKLHHLFKNGLGLAVGYENALAWGGPDQGQSLFAVASYFIILKEDAKAMFSLLTLHLGAGDGRFRSVSQTLSGKQSWNLYGSMGLRVIEPLAVVLNWTGSDIETGISVAPFHTLPLTFGLSAIGLSQPYGSKPRAAFVVTYGDSVTSENFPINTFK